MKIVDPSGYPLYNIFMSTIHKTCALPGSRTLQFAQGDLTREPVDAIVNAANKHLAHGGGIAAAIVRAGGSIIQQESDDWISQNGPVLYDKPAYTGAGSMPARFVIHAVGPHWGEGDEDRKLSEAIRGSLWRASELGLESIALPAISTGIFGFPKERAANLFFENIPAYFQENPESSLKLVRLVLWDQIDLDIFLRAAEILR